ncbi:MAG: DUF3460 family protein [Chromatiaceae bacterium]
MEFTGFMEQFLRDHPEVVEDQQHDWDIYWNPNDSHPIKLNLLRPGSRSGQPA